MWSTNTYSNRWLTTHTPSCIGQTCAVHPPPHALVVVGSSKESTESIGCPGYPRRLKSAHGPRGHASLKHTSTAVRPALLKEGFDRFLHVRRAQSRGARLVLDAHRLLHGAFRVTYTIALFCSESTCAHVHVATACIRGSGAGYAPPPVMISMGSFPLRSMLEQFLCQASRKAPSLRKALREQGHRSRGSPEG